MFRSLRRPGVLALTLAAAGTLLITQGSRTSFGLLVGPLNTATGLGIVTISFAMAVGQFVWGAVQPLAGIAADRYGARRVLIAGVLMMALGSAVTPYVTSAAGLTVAIGLLAAMGSGAASFSVLIGAVAQRLPAESRAEASGVINAGGSLGQFVLAPAVQKLIQTFGHVGALWGLAIAALAALPLISRVTGGGRRADAAPSPTPAVPAPSSAPKGGALRAIGDAMKDRSYLLLHAGFFTCGFHIAFLVTHLPGEVDLCGLPPSVASWSLAIIGLANVAGSLYSGACVARYRSKYVLAWMYGSRAVLVALYLVAPKTAWTFYLFAAGLGFTWLATVPPTAAIVSKLFGIRHLATLFGMTLLSHQIGGFLGAWLGGLAITRFGDYTWMWYADMALAAAAALVNLPIREARVARPAAQPV